MDHSPAAPSITVTELTFRYFTFAPAALKDVSFELPSGGFTAVLGPTGAGKTTLLQILSGISGSLTTSQATGSVAIGTERFSPLPPQVLFPIVGYFMQDPSVQLSGIHDTVEDEIAFALQNLGIPPGDQSQRVSEILAQMKLSHLAKRHPLHISGGELQKVLLASLLVARPSVLLLDEPSNSLDPGSQHLLVRMLRSLRNTTVLFTDHHIDFALQVAEHFLVLNNGSVLFSGGKPSFLRHLADFRDILPVSSWIDILPSLLDGKQRPFSFMRNQ